MKEEEFDEIEFEAYMPVKVLGIIPMRVWGIEFVKRRMTSKVLWYLGIWIPCKWICVE